jgi:hypothetical protein
MRAVEQGEGEQRSAFSEAGCGCAPMLNKSLFDWDGDMPLLLHFLIALAQGRAPPQLGSPASKSSSTYYLVCLPGSS